MTEIPEEIALAIRYPLGLATRARIADWVDRRVLAMDAMDRVDGDLLALTTLSERTPEDVAARLFRLSAVTRADQLAVLSVRVVGQALDAGELELEHVVAILACNLAFDLPEPLRAAAQALESAHFVSPPSGVARQVRELVAACVAWTPESAAG